MPLLETLKMILKTFKLAIVLYVSFWPMLSCADIGDDELLQRGEYLALAGNCHSCHTVEKDTFMAGGVPFETPFGRVYSTNITPDMATGIGAWTFEDFSNSMRQGIRPDRTHLYPVFPYTSFAQLIDDDLLAIFSYLKSIPAITQSAPDNDLPFPFNIRQFLAIWKYLFLNKHIFEVDSSRPDSWNRGAYLVEALTHCGLCHSPRNFLGAEKRHSEMAGGAYSDRIPGIGYRTWFAPNLTSAPTGLSLWSHEDTFSYLKTGRNSLVDSFGPMNEVIFNSTQHLDDEDLDAIALYLKSLPPISVAESRPADRKTMGMGRTIYNLHCGTCHLPTGLGDPEMAPRLNQGSLVVQAENPASLINVILYGPQEPKPPLPPKWFNPMDEFQYMLDDAEVAALATYIRNSWNNNAGLVTARQVAKQR